MRRKIMAFTMVMMVLFSLSSCKKQGVDLCEPAVREYLDAKKEADQISVLVAQSGTNLAHQVLSFQWESSGSNEFKVYFADNQEYQNATVYETYVPYVNPHSIFVPGRTYYWKVENSQTGAVVHQDSFTLMDAPVRFINTNQVTNVRDVGGWKTEDGKQVKYEMIYRGGMTNPNGENRFPESDAILFRDYLGIKTEIDLRTPGKDDRDQTVSILGEDAAYYKTPMDGYCNIIPGFRQTTPIVRSYSRESVKSIREIFHILADPNNYPVYIHCNAGADRTGTIVYLINGLLGVSYQDLTRDYELTSFSQSGRRWRSDIVNESTFDPSGVMQDDQENYVAWGKMHQMMEEKYGSGSLQKTIEKYLTEVCGVPQEDIDSLRKIMLQ